MNTELLQRTMQHLLDHPEQHDQQVWVSECGTTACFAGWALKLSGVDQFMTLTKCHQTNSTWQDCEYYGKTHTIQGLAQGLLDLTDEQTEILFDDFNTIPMLELMVKDLVNGNPLKLTIDYR